VVRQHGDELGLVGEEGVEVLLGDLGERRVGRREHGERALALERVDQAGLLECDGEGLEVAGGNRGVDDVLGLDGSGGERQSADDEEFLHGRILGKGRLRELLRHALSWTKCVMSVE
jgi:hypothetical protein